MKIPHQMLWSAVGGFALATGAYAGGGSGQAEVKMMDTDGDGSISAAEHAAGAKKMFEMMDADGDGIVTAKEMEAAHKDMPTAQRGSSGESDTQDASRLKGNSMHHDKSAAAKIKMITRTVTARSPRPSTKPARRRCSRRWTRITTAS